MVIMMRPLQGPHFSELDLRGKGGRAYKTTTKERLPVELVEGEHSFDLRTGTSGFR